MYQYVWDEETGAPLLTTEVSKFSKEPRPVYYKELDILGFDRYWNYPKDDSAPLMWAEANNYIYKGRLVAKTKGGALYTPPEIILIEDPEPNAGQLQFVDIEGMIAKNAELMETLVQETIQKVYNTYKRYRTKIDVFYVAFSGGKDSVVALDIVQRALPHDEFIVIFGDTQMEFPDTYALVDEVKSDCDKERIKFYISKSEFTPEYTWNEFGPPAQKIRWCCSVLKTSPQLVLLRQLTNNPAFRGMAFTGIRGDESVSRSQYEEISYGDKHKGQYSYHTILDWSSAETFIYIYANKLRLNDGYKKGNSRIGCLVCPMASDKNFFFKEISYKTSNISADYTTTKYNEIILNTSSKPFSNKREKDNFMDMCGWKARRSGRELNFPQEWCIETLEDGILTVIILREKTDWKEWIKTLGDVVSLSDENIEIVYNNKKYLITRQISGNKQIFKVNLKDNTKDDIYFGSGLKTVLRKSAYCIGCHVCEVNCPHGFITMKNGNVKIDDRCFKCKKCHEVFHGCLVANSIKLPKEVKKMGSVDRYGNIGVEYEWVLDFFEKKDSFWENNSLGTNKIKNMKAFLSDADIVNPKKYTISDFGKTLDKIGINTATAWGLALSNLAYTSEINWWIMHTVVNQIYKPIEIDKMLEEVVASADSRNHIVSAYKNIFYSNNILGTEIGLGICALKEGTKQRKLIDITRNHWSTPEPRVILYSLFKFAENCGGLTQFTLSELLDDTIERDGISPTRIFGLDRDTMVPLLNGLAANYPDFISASFTLGLETITLSSEKSSNDVLELF